MSSEPHQEENLSKKLFIIAPIGEVDSDTRNRSNKVKRHIIDPPAKELGYETIRADQISEPGRIDNQIIECILNFELAVTDITEQNPNVFYELAVRHAIRKPVILLGRIGERLPFDVSSQRVIFYDLTDPDNVVHSKEELKKQIQSVESNNFVVDSPIRRSVDQLVPRGRDSKDLNQEIIAILRNQSSTLSELKLIVKKESEFLKNEVWSRIIPRTIIAPTSQVVFNELRIAMNEINTLKNLISQGGEIDKALVNNLSSRIVRTYSSLLNRHTIRRVPPSQPSTETT